MIMTSELHNFDLGDIVTVFNCTPGGTFVIEGRAFITDIRDGEDMYDVQFRDEKLCTSQGKVTGGRQRADNRSYLRYVDPNGQEDPETYLKVLNAHRAPTRETEEPNKLRGEWKY